MLEGWGSQARYNFGGMGNTQGVKMLEQVGALAEGYTAPRTGPWYDETEIPGIKLMQDLRQKYGRPFDFAGDDQNGTVTAMVACEVVKRALDSMKDFDCDGIKQITYTPEDHRGWNKARIYQVQGGEVIPVSDWKETPMIMPEK
jgi:hypothetical protein